MDTVGQAVQKAQRDLDSLEDQKAALFHRAKALSKAREAISFTALTAGDAKAKEELRKINLEDVSQAANIASVESALVVAKSNLAAAKANEAKAADREQAKQIAELNAKLKEELDNADDALSDAMGSVLTARDLLQKMHALGVSSPTDQMYRINSVACIKTAIQKLPSPFISDFEFMRLAPSQKKTFRPLAEGWCNQIENQIADRLPEKQKVA